MNLMLFVSLNLLSLVLAFMLDQWLGDPRSSLHPVCLMGRLNRWLETFLHPWGFFGGLLLTLFSVTMASLLPAIALYLSWQWHLLAYVVVNTLIIAICISSKSMEEHALAVHTPLAAGELENARHALSMIVSRHTSELDETEVARSTVESVAENFTDGVLSPALYAALGGGTAAMFFKAISTLDSMVGYRNERYQHFGTFAARSDDLLNFLPARLSIPIIALATLFTPRASAAGALRAAARYRKAHPSPNSAHSMAAFAGALGVQLGGPATYHGQRKEKPWVGDGTEPLNAQTIQNATRLFSAATTVVMFLAVAIFGITWHLAPCPLL